MHEQQPGTGELGQCDRAVTGFPLDRDRCSGREGGKLRFAARLESVRKPVDAMTVLGMHHDGAVAFANASHDLKDCRVVEHESRIGHEDLVGAQAVSHQGWNILAKKLRRDRREDHVKRIVDDRRRRLPSVVLDCLPERGARAG